MSEAVARGVLQALIVVLAFAMVGAFAWSGIAKMRAMNDVIDTCTDVFVHSNLDVDSSQSEIRFRIEQLNECAERQHEESAGFLADLAGEPEDLREAAQRHEEEADRLLKVLRYNSASR